MTARLIVLAACAFAAALSAKAATVSISEPRAFGYFLGDTLRRDVLVRTKAGEKLDLSSLPRPGPLNYWLELSSADLVEGRDGDDKLYRLSLLYQTFYAPLDPRRLTIPGFKLKVDGSGGTELAVPPFNFIASPIRQLFSEKGDTPAEATKLQPDHVGHRLATGAERTALLVASLLALSALALLARHYAWWPFRQRPGRPFTHAARFLRDNASTLHNGAGYRTALLRLHRAFDVAAGRRVLSEDVDDFLSRHPQFAPMSAEVERLFQSSREAFFANDIERARQGMPLEAVTELGERLGAAERNAA